MDQGFGGVIRASRTGRVCVGPYARALGLHACTLGRFRCPAWRP